jgi:hypothetical protein
VALLQFERRTEVTPRLAKPYVVGGLLHGVLLLLFLMQLRELWCHRTGLEQSRAGRRGRRLVAECYLSYFGLPFPDFR